MSGFAASVLAGSSGTFERLLQFIASGALGEASFRGARKTAALGLLFHFVIAFTAAAVYFAASRSLPLLIAQPVLCGIVYGILIHLFMTFVTIPLFPVLPNANSPPVFSSVNSPSTCSSLASRSPSHR